MPSASVPSILGIDFGGTKTAIARFELPNFVRRELVVVPTQAARGFAAVRDHLLEETRKVTTPDVRAIGIGIAGLVDARTGRILKMPNVPGAEGQDIAEVFRKEIGFLTHVENDSHCFAYAEAMAGVGRGERVVVGITMGTGVGGGIIVDGKIFHGAHGYAGEVGHMLLKPGEPPYPTKDMRGEVEQFLSGTAMGRRCEAAKDPGEYLGGEACEFMQPHIFKEVAWLVTNLTHAVDPSMVIFGGAAGRALKPHLSKVETELKKWMLPGTPIPRLAVGTLDDAGVRGAAMLAATSS